MLGPVVFVVVFAVLAPLWLVFWSATIARPPRSTVADLIWHLLGVPASFLRRRRLSRLT
jgi:hypothetical protein